MSHQVLVDYHFHPNLPKDSRSAEKKAKQIWEAFENVGLAAVLVTEHNYKHPKRTFEIMAKTRPRDASCVIFPGVEVLTKEGVDVVCFARHESIYDHPYLTKPGHLKLDDLLDKIIELKTVYGFVTHPFALSKTGMIKQEGVLYTKKAVQRLRAVEVHNSCYDELMPLLNKLGIQKILPRQYRCMKRTTLLPDDWQDIDIDFYALSSDAHTIRFIGGGGYITAQSNDENDLFDAIIHNKLVEIASPSIKKGFGDVLKYGMETFREWLMKR